MTLRSIFIILGILGVYGFFIGNLLLVIIGGLAGLFENIRGFSSGQQTSLLTAIIAIIAGIFYSSSVGLSFWIGALIGLCFEKAIVGIVGLLLLGITYIKK